MTSRPIALDFCVVASAYARQLNALGVKIAGMQSEVPDLEKYKAEQVFECAPPFGAHIKDVRTDIDRGQAQCSKIRN